MHRAFYVENKDTTKAETFAEAAADVGVEASAFAEAFASDEMLHRTASDFHFSRRLGVSGYPTVVLNDRSGYAYLTVGYRPFDALAPHLEAWAEA